MAIRQELPSFDPLARAIPGQSFTDAPGVRPYERPATSSDPKQILSSLENSLQEEDTQKRIADMLDVGVSAETISDGVMMKCFTEGMCTPDVAELVKPGIFIIIVQIGVDNQIDDMVLFNEDEEDPEMAEEKKLFLMSKLSPDKFRDITKGIADEQPGEEDMAEFEDAFMESQFEEQGDISEDSSEMQGSFLDMQDEEMVFDEEEEG